MKKVYCFLMVSLWVITSPASAQNAFYHAKKIDSLLKNINVSNPKEAREKLANMVLPYFVTDGILQNDKLKEFISPALYNQLDLFFQEKQAEEKVVKDFATQILGKKDSLYIFFDTLDSKRALLNKIRANYNNVSVFLTNTDASHIGTDYNPVAFEDSLKRLIALERIEIDSVKEQIRIKEFARLKAYLGLQNQTTQAVADAFKNAKQYVSEINTRKAEISRYLKKPDVLKKFSEFVATRQGLRAATADQQEKAVSLAISHIEPIASNLATVMNTSNIGGTASLSNFKMLSEAELIDALAIYMAKRFKQEVALSFVSMLRSEINKRELVREMFPKTIQLFLEGDTYELPKLGSVWHYSIAEDIANLPFNLKESKFIKRTVGDTSSSSYYSLFVDMVNIGEMARKKNSLPDMVVLYKSKAEPFRNKYVSSTFEVLNLINTEMVRENSQNENKFWVNWQELNKMTPSEWETFLNLVAFKYNSELFGSMQVPKLWTSEKRQQFKSYLMKVLIALNSFETSQAEVLKAFEKNPAQAFKGISFWDVQQTLFSTIMDDRFFTFTEKGKKTLSIINRSVGLYKLMEEKNYPAMVNESIAITETLFPEQSARLNELLIKPWKLEKSKFEDAVPMVQNLLSDINLFYIQVGSVRGDAIKMKEVLERKATECNIKFDNTAWTESQKEYVSEILKLISNKLYRDLESLNMAKRLMVVKSEEGFHQLLANASSTTPVKWADAINRRGANFTAVLKTAEFFTDVMSATDSKQLSNVIEAHAMSPNSYKIKRNSRLSIDLNSYVGFYGGGEFLEKNAPGNIKSNAVVWGLSAPIGIAISRGTRKDASPNKPASFINRNGNAKALKGNSFSLNLTLIDIAAAVSYRLSNDGEEALPKSLKWSQLLSPGLHARWGIKNTPLCFSVGTQYTPQIRNLNQPSQDQQAYRAYAGLFFDLPLFNIYKR